MGETIRYLGEAEKERARALWSQAFPDETKESDDYYFHEKIRSSRVLVKEDNGALIAMLHRNPYRLRLGEEEAELDYIVGVATDPNRRHQGHMRDLLRRLLADSLREGKPFCYLMPANEAIYHPFGFRFIFDQPRLGLKQPGPAEGRLATETVLAARLLEDHAKTEEFSRFMEAWLADRYRVYAIRDTGYTVQLLKELASEQGQVEFLRESGRLMGLRAVWGIREREQRFLYCGEEWTWEEKPPRPAIMGRIANLERFFKLFRLKPGQAGPLEICLRVTDPLLAENNGIWLWSLTETGADIRRLEADAGEEKGSPAGAFACDVSQLLPWLTGYIPAEEWFPGEGAPPWAGKLRLLGKIFLDEVV